MARDNLNSHLRLCDGEIAVIRNATNLTVRITVDGVTTERFVPSDLLLTFAQDLLDEVREAQGDFGLAASLTFPPKRDQ